MMRSPLGPWRAWRRMWPRALSHNWSLLPPELWSRGHGLSGESQLMGFCKGLVLLKRYIGSSCLLGFLKTCAGASTLTQRQVHPKPFEPPQSASDINTRPARNNRVQAMLCQIFPISHWNVWQQFCSRSAQVWRRCFSENWRHLPYITVKAKQVHACLPTHFSGCVMTWGALRHSNLVQWQWALALDSSG